MIIEITGRHISINEALKEHAREKLDHVLRHHDKIVSAHVILDVEKTRHTAEMIVHGRNLSATVHADSDDLHAAIDRCADKLRHHLEHHHGKRRDKRRRADALATAEAAAIAEGLAAGILPPAAAAEPVKPKRPAPRVVRAAPMHAEPMTVDEAAHELEDGDLEFLVFRDAETEMVNVLFRQRDGVIGLIETGAD